MKIIIQAFSSGQFTETILGNIEFYIDDRYDDEIIGACLAALIRDDSDKFIDRIKGIIDRVPNQMITEAGLRNILPSLDTLRNRLFELIRLEQFVLFFTVLNACLLRIEFPIKFYVSWTSCLLKAALEHQKSPHISNLAAGSLAGLLDRFDGIPQEMKPKVQKIVLQSLSLSNDCALLERCVKMFEASLSVILEASFYNLSQEYFCELSSHVLSSVDHDKEESFLVSWIRVLSYQVQVNPKCFQISNAKKLHLLAKLIFAEIFDPIKSGQYLDLIYNRMAEIGCPSDTISLSRQIISFNKTKTCTFIVKYDDKNAQIAIDLVEYFQSSEQLNLKLFSFDSVLIEDDTIEFEIYNFILNLALVYTSIEDFKEILNQFRDDSNIIKRMNYLFFDNNLTNWSISPEISKIHLFYEQEKVNSFVLTC